MHYNLDAILSVGYRINSKRGTQFRQWAKQWLKDYLDVIAKMKSSFASDVFAMPKDKGFESSIKHIKQTFNGKDLYLSISRPDLICCIQQA